MQIVVLLALLFFSVALVNSASPPWPNAAHDSSHTRFTANGPTVTAPWTVGTNYSFISSLGPAVDSNGITYIVAALGDGCALVSFDPLTGAQSTLWTCPVGSALSLYTGIVITNNAAGDVVLFPLLAPNGWTLVAITTAGKPLWSAQTVGAMAPPQVSIDGTQVFVVGLHPANTSVIYAHDTATGNINWSTTLSLWKAGGTTGTNVQLFNDDEGAIYTVLQLGYNFQFYNSTVYRLSATSGALLWKMNYRTSLATDVVYSTVISAIVFSDASNLVAYSSRTGRQMWTTPLPLETCIGTVMNDPVSGNFYFTCQDSTMLAVSANGSLLWTYAIRSAPGALGFVSMAVRSPINDTAAGAVVYSGQANLNNFSVPIAALSSKGALLWSKAVRDLLYNMSLEYATLYLVGPNVCAYYSAGGDLNPTVTVSCFPGTFSS